MTSPKPDKWLFNMDDFRLFYHNSNVSVLHIFIESEIQRNVSKALEKVRLKKYEPVREGERVWDAIIDDLIINISNSKIEQVKKEYGI